MSHQTTTPPRKMDSAAYDAVPANSDDELDDDRRAAAAAATADAGGAVQGEQAGHGAGEEEVGGGDDCGTTCGLSSLSVLCVALGVWALCRAGGEPAAVVWALSSATCGALAGWVGVLAGIGALAGIFRVTYVALVAFTVAKHLSAAAGMAVIFFDAVATAAFFGYYFAARDIISCPAKSPPSTSPESASNSSPVQGDDLV
uniref:Uncharacterized protein n=1 Tax=Oryza glumipatula TaxID=40148 RepID=A0A0E0BG04_9ORYZ